MSFKTIHDEWHYIYIGQQDFERILLKTAIAELKNRISVIRSSGIFNDWSYPDQIRLARM